MNSIKRSTPLAVIAAMLALSAPVPSFAASDEIEEVVVTGSRIARDSNLTGAQPIQGVSSEDIAESGEFALMDVVNDIPALIGSLSQEMSIDSGFADGANLLNLRNLGINRTLTLVDGRRHVGGVQGSAAVDIGSIPKQLVERVEVLTGGASAVYGADAVTGVVNFILKDDFEGFEIDVNAAVSGEGDGRQSSIGAIWGKNFSDGRGNIVIAVDYSKDDGLRMSERPGATYGTGDDYSNPALRFQNGNISASTPNFQAYYNYANTGLFPVGLPIPTSQGFIDNYNAAFPDAPITAGDLTSAELALIDQAGSAFPRAIFPEATFSITSGYGWLIPGDPFSFAGFDPETPIDLNGNGTPDCLDSFAGYNSVFGTASFGVVGGCWYQQADGSYAVNEDGLVAGNFNGFGGTSTDVYLNDQMDFLLPDQKIAINVNARYDLTDSVRAFAELKWVDQSTDTGGFSNSFWDLLYGAADNPYLPEFIADVAAGYGGGVALTVDPIYFGAERRTDRETVRAVFGIEGALNDNMDYEVSVNFGRFTQDRAFPNEVIVDRFFAAIDAVTDPATGAPACRSSVDPTAPALNTPFGIPAYDEGYFSFVPGDGQCAPLNIFAGEAGVSQAAKDFVLIETKNSLELTQLVLSGVVTGDTSSFFELPGGAPGFAAGLEYRKEESDADFSPWSRGVLPAGSNFTPGTLISEVSGNGSLVFDPGLADNNEQGDYTVTELFLELSLPLLADVPGARELTVDLAARFSDYDSIGQTTTWRSTLIYAPVNDFAVRATYSEAVRAPNITELYGPVTSATFRPTDPCDATYIAGVDAALGANLQANCTTYFQSIGIDPFDADGNYAYLDPLSARFGGLTGGNPNLSEETAETLTYGFVFQPSFLDGFSLTFDVWDISIEDAIQSVRADDIVLGCYQGAELNNQFCDLFDRNDDPNSLQAGGFTFMRTGLLNYAKSETDGYDLAANYAFELGEHMFSIRVSGTKVNDNTRYQNPLDLSEKDPELLEIGAPEYAGNIFLKYQIGSLSLGWQSQFISEMLLGNGPEVETYETLFGPSVLMDDMWIHDFNGSYAIQDNVNLSFGVRNVTEEEPFITANAYPVSPRGRMFWMGLNLSL